VPWVPISAACSAAEMAAHLEAIPVDKSADAMAATKAEMLVAQLVCQWVLLMASPLAARKVPQ
jgi:hypothetical protein